MVVFPSEDDLAVEMTEEVAPFFVDIETRLAGKNVLLNSTQFVAKLSFLPHQLCIKDLILVVLIHEKQRALDVNVILGTVKMRC